MINDILRNKITGKYYRHNSNDIKSIEDASLFSNHVPKIWHPLYTRISYENELRKIKLEKIKNK